MKFNLQFFAQDRTNMVSLLDIGLLMGGNAGKLAEMGDGLQRLQRTGDPVQTPSSTSI